MNAVGINIFGGLNFLGGQIFWGVQKCWFKKFWGDKFFGGPNFYKSIFLAIFFMGGGSFISYLACYIF